MANKVKVSVVVTTYNRELLLRETITSILAQTYQNFELIVIDNYSDYDFYGLIESFGSDKIRAFQNHNNGVIAVNRNLGINYANGEYIAFCDDDDIWLPNKLELQVDYMSHHQVDIISSEFYYFGDEIEESVSDRKYKSKLDVYLKNYIAPSTVLVKNVKELKFDERPPFNCAEDWMLWLELFLNDYRLYQMPETLVRYRVLKSSSTAKNIIQPHRRAIWILRELKKKYGSKFSTTLYVLSLMYHYVALIAHKCV